MKRIALIVLAVSFLIWQSSAGVAISQNLEDQILPSFYEKDEINNPKLSPTLNRLIQEMKTDGVRGAQDYGESRALDMDDGLVWAVIEMDTDPSVNLSEELQVQIRERIEAFGGVWELVYRNQIQVWLPLEALEDVASWPNVTLIREPIKFLPSDGLKNLTIPDSGSEEDHLRTNQAVEVVSQGVSITGAAAWHSSGFNGSGVKVAVIDGGFEGYSALLGAELPSTVQIYTQGNTTKFNSGEHGTACAEIIHDVAPGAALYLVRSETNVEWGAAVDWCKARGVKVISCSMGMHVGPHDGTGMANDIVNDAIDHGITLIVAAGNDAQSHWSGNFLDNDGNKIHDFTPADEVNAIIGSNLGNPIGVYMTWNDPWGYSSNDYDLLIARLNPLSIVLTSESVQNGNDDPFEGGIFSPILGIYYGFAIGKYLGAIKKLHVFVPNYTLEYQTAASSLGIPADNEKAITVGAVAWNSPSVIEAFSSRGPTVDGRIKPDLVAPDKVSTVSYGTSAFPGTSASCPHVAGACALVLQKNPSWTPAQVKSYLESNAVDLGVAGKDNVYGSGRLLLPDPGSVPVGENTYYIPYFIADSSFGTGVAIRNIGTSAAHVTIRYYAQNGTLLGEEGKTIAARGQTAFLAGSELINKQGWIKINSDVSVTGLCLIAHTKPLDLTFDITMIPKLTKNLYVPHVAQNKNWDTFIYVCNPNDSSASVKLTFVDETGKAVSNKTYSIPKNGSAKLAVSNLVSNYNNGSVEILSDKGVAAFALYQDLKNGGYSYAGLSAVDPADY